MALDPEVAHLIRGLVARGLVEKTNDEQETQTASVMVYRHVERRDVEVMQQFGVASRPPKGSLMVLLAVGGDQGDLVGLPLPDPENRLGWLEEGESALYGQDGSRVHMKADGSIDVRTSKRVWVQCPSAEFEIKDTLIRGRLAAGGPRVVVQPDHCKLWNGGNYIVVTPGGVFSSVPVVVGPDPGDAP